MQLILFVLSTVLAFFASPSLQNKANSSSLAPLYFLFPNFLTISEAEVSKYIRKNVFEQKNMLGFAAMTSLDCSGNENLVPVYRFSNNLSQQYLYSTNASVSNQASTLYTLDDIAFYAATTLNECGATVPLHSYKVGPHRVYCTDKANADAVLIEKEGGIYEGAICYIWAAGRPELPVTLPPTTEPPTTLPPTTEPPTTKRLVTTRRPVCSVNSVPLRRLIKRSSQNHFYTASESEAQNFQSNNYTIELSPGKVATSASDCSCESNFIPVYRLYKPPTLFGYFEDHFYTASEDEAEKATSTLGYNRQGIAFYCSPVAGRCGATVPLHRYATILEHFYTSDLNEGTTNVLPYYGSYEGIVCYIWP